MLVMKTTALHDQTITLVCGLFQTLGADFDGLDIVDTSGGEFCCAISVEHGGYAVRNFLVFLLAELLLLNKKKRKP